MKYFNIKTLTILFLLISSCSQLGKSSGKIDKPIKKKGSIISSCDTNLNKIPEKSISFGIDNDEEKVVYLRRAKYIVYQNLKTKKYSIKLGNKVLLRDLKYFTKLGGRGLQVLNSKNEIVYYTLDLKKLTNKSELPKSELFFCGNVSCWKLSIEKKDDYYIVNKMAGHSGSFSNAKWEIVDSISAENIEDIHFLHHDKTLEYNDNVRASEIIIIKYKDNQAIRIDKKSFYFDSIDTSNNIKVQCNGLFGYFGITEAKYKELGVFEFNLAPFVLDDGRKGYVDYQGNEHFNTKNN